jgi:two-component system osmolarity sensor histidine kinase EnvZ
MLFTWLKRYMPQSLYGRAALILIFPIVFLQFAVSLVFIQRHFEGVTQQMTAGVALELHYLSDRIAETNTRDQAAQVMEGFVAAFKLSPEFVAPEAVPDTDFRRFLDISGIYVIRALLKAMPNVGPVVMKTDFDISVFLPSKYGPIKVDFARGRVSANNAHQLIVWTIGIGVLLIVISYVFLKNQLRPIKRLALAADAFGKGRHLPYSLSGASEVRSAGQAFLDMRARIERHIEQRTLLLSGVSHDLRTPLTRLKLALSMSDDPDATGMLRDVEDMQRLLDEFLSFARRGSESNLQMEDSDPREIVADIVAAERKRGTNVTLNDVQGSGLVTLHPLSIKRALENLIGNAAVFGDTIEVSLEINANSLQISVEDNGPGIPPDKREEAMKPFARLDSSRNQNKNTGVGLGLPIVSDIARAHGGELRLMKSKLGGLKAQLTIAR